jgi:hypothetical protein
LARNVRWSRMTRIVAEIANSGPNAASDGTQSSKTFCRRFGKFTDIVLIMNNKLV